jgi:hypothetical protein
MDGLVAWMAGCLLRSYEVSGGGRARTLSTISLTGTGRLIIQVTFNILDFFKLLKWQYYISTQFFLFRKEKQASLNK